MVWGGSVLSRQLSRLRRQLSLSASGRKKHFLDSPSSALAVFFTCAFIWETISKKKNNFSSRHRRCYPPHAALPIHRPFRLVAPSPSHRPHCPPPPPTFFSLYLLNRNGKVNGKFKAMNRKWRKPGASRWVSVSSRAGALRLFPALAL